MTKKSSVKSQFDATFAKLANPNWYTRRIAVDEVIEFVRTHPDPQSYTRAVLLRLVDEALCPSSFNARSAALEILESLGDMAVDIVMEALEQRDGATHVLVDLLHTIASPKHVPALVQLMRERSDAPLLRASIVSALGSIGGPPAVEALVGCLEDENEEVRIFAIDALCAAQHSVPLRSLIDFIHHPRTRNAALALLGCSHDFAALSIWIRFLENPTPGLGSVALTGLSQWLDWAIDAADDDECQVIARRLFDLSEATRAHMLHLAKNGGEKVVLAGLNIAVLTKDLRWLAPATRYVEQKEILGAALRLAAVGAKKTQDYFEPWLFDAARYAELPAIFTLISATGVTANPRWIRFLIERVHPGQGELARYACAALAEVGDLSVVDALWQRCEDSSLLGDLAADALARILERFGVAPLARLLPSGLAFPAQGSKARHLCRILAATTDPQAGDYYAEVMVRAKGLIRVEAVAAMGLRTLDPRCTELLIAAFDDPSEQVRAMACLSVGRAKQKEFEFPLLRALSDYDLRVRVEALRALVKLGGGRTKNALRRIIAKRDDHELVIEAIEALASLGEPEDLPLLIHLCTHTKVDWARSAAQALSVYSDEAATQTLVDLLSHPEWELRWTATQALRQRRSEPERGVEGEQSLRAPLPAEREAWGKAA